MQGKNNAVWLYLWGDSKSFFNVCISSSFKLLILFLRYYFKLLILFTNHHSGNIISVVKLKEMEQQDVWEHPLLTVISTRLNMADSKYLFFWTMTIVWWIIVHITSALKTLV